jgi:hypothetical protein
MIVQRSVPGYVGVMPATILNNQSDHSNISNKHLNFGWRRLAID